MNSDSFTKILWCIRVPPWFLSSYPWWSNTPLFEVLNHRESGRISRVIIRTYERFWGWRKLATRVFGLKTTAQKRGGAKMGLFWSTFWIFWTIFCKKWIVFCKNGEELNGFCRFWKRRRRFRAESKNKDLPQKIRLQNKKLVKKNFKMRSRDRREKRDI